MEHPQENEHWNVSPEEHVFSNDFLRKKILGYLVQSYYTFDIPSLRLVSKVWLADVHTLLLDSGNPLYDVYLNENNSLNESDYVREKGVKILDNFISICSVAASPSRVENEILPFKLTIYPEFFVSENHQSFSEFLASGIVAGLMQLEINVLKNGGSLDFLLRGSRFPSFPILKNLCVNFCGEEQHSVTDEKTHGSNSYFLPLIQCILDGTNGLTEFSLCNFSASDSLPAGIRYLVLPSSLTKLSLFCLLTSSQLEGLAMNSFPNLHHLHLNIPGTPYANDLISKVLHKYKNTLRNLMFSASYQSGELPRIATQFAFPVMQHLDSFACTSTHAEMEAGISSLQNCLPSLKTLFLTRQSVNMFRKWTENSCFPGVTRLTVGLVDDSVAQDSASFYMPFCLEEMLGLHRAFPNVTALELFVTGSDMSGLRYLFREMQQIKELTIQLMNSSESSKSIHWDALLIGLPFELLEQLENNPAENYDLKVNKSSLKNLIGRYIWLLALRSLQLASFNEPRGADLALPQESLLSDAVFHLVLLKMPTLKKLSLRGRFKASTSATQVWEAAGRSIFYLQ